MPGMAGVHPQFAASAGECTTHILALCCTNCLCPSDAACMHSADPALPVPCCILHRHDHDQAGTALALVASMVMASRRVPRIGPSTYEGQIVTSSRPCCLLRSQACLSASTCGAHVHVSHLTPVAPSAHVCLTTTMKAAALHAAESAAQIC